jgi:YD repeat-containing protein
VTPHDRAQRGLLLLVAGFAEAPFGALRSTAAHLAHLCDRAGLLYDERLDEGLLRHAADVRAGGRAPRGPLELRAWRPPLRLDAGGPNEQRAWLAEDALAGAHAGEAPIAERVTEALRDLAHGADRLGEDPSAVLDLAADADHRRQRREHARARRDRERFPDEDPVVAALARRAAELDARSDFLTSAPVAAWRWASPGSTFWHAEPLYAERNRLPPGEWCDERPDGEADEVGFDASGRAVAVRGWRVGAGGEPRPLEERLRWPAGPGVRETAYLRLAHLHWAGRERVDDAGRLTESWQLWHARSWMRERFAYDEQGRLARVHRLHAIATPEHTTSHPVESWQHVRYADDGALLTIEHERDPAPGVRR